jgi:tetratricopeptide (TPR) repeat protein
MFIAYILIAMSEIYNLSRNASLPPIDKQIAHSRRNSSFTTIGLMRKAVSIVAATLLAVFLMTTDLYAAEYELSLFDKGYQYYLSYQPQEAMETFHIFLKEFPNSSVKDAALFWLGRSLVKLQLFEAARDIFLQLKDEIPDSPFTKYVDNELKAMNAQTAEKDSGTNIDLVHSEIQALRDEKAHAEKSISLLTEERDNLRLQLEEEKRKNDKAEAIERENDKRDSVNYIDRVCPETQTLKDEKAQTEKIFSELTTERDALRLLLEEERITNQELRARVDRFDSELREVLDKLQTLRMSSEDDRANSTILKSQNRALSPIAREDKKEVTELLKGNNIIKDSTQDIKEKQGNTVKPIDDAAQLQRVAKQTSSHTLELIANEETWIFVTIDDTDSRERLLKPGTRIKWIAKKHFSLRVGNAGGIKVIFNGKDIGPLGEKGKVVKLKLPSFNFSNSKKDSSSVL